jgi:hypothetical protein
VLHHQSKECQRIDEATMKAMKEVFLVEGVEILNSLKDSTGRQNRVFWWAA